MRLTKDNKLKLGRNERRVGNFVVRDEDTHMKVMDIGQVFTHRADKRTPVGQFLEGCYVALDRDESTGKGLGNWLAVIFTVFSVVPDIDFLEAVMKASTECMERHPEAYGAQKDGTDEENDAAAREVKEMMDFDEEVKKIQDEEPAKE